MATADKSKTKSTGKSATGPVSAKAAVKARREAEARRRQQQQRILLAIAAVTVLAVVAIIILIQIQPVEAAIPDEVKTAYQGIPSGRTADGFYFIGAENAATTIEEFSSFSCSACLNYHKSTFKNLVDKFKDGSLKFVYLPLTKYGSYLADGQARGAICAGEQGKFWEMHDVMFDWQGRYGNGANDYRRLTNAAAALGLDTAKFGACLTADSTTQLITKAEEIATARGVNSTPHVFLNGQKVYPDMAGRDQPPGLNEIRGLIEANAAAK